MGNSKPPAMRVQRRGNNRGVLNAKLFGNEILGDLDYGRDGFG